MLDLDSVKLEVLPTDGPLARLMVEHWTKGYYAKDATGRMVTSKDPQATCWCLEGAAMKLDLPEDPLRAAARKLLGNSYVSLVHSNDRLGQKAAVAIAREAGL